MRRYLKHFMKVLIKTETHQTAAILEDLLQPSFSEEGTNKRQTEENIFMNLSFFLQDVEGRNPNTLCFLAIACMPVKNGNL